MASVNSDHLNSLDFRKVSRSKMHAFIINSERDSWGQTVANKLEGRFGSTAVLELFRQSLRKGIASRAGTHINDEGARLAEFADGCVAPYIAVARAGGGFAVAKAMKEYGFGPRLAVFAEFPLQTYDRRIPIRHMLRGLEVPTLFINQPDPTGNQAEAFYELTDDLGMTDVRLIESIKGIQPAQVGRIVTGYMPADVIAA